MAYTNTIQNKLITNKGNKASPESNVLKKTFFSVLVFFMLMFFIAMLTSQYYPKYQPLNKHYTFDLPLEYKLGSSH